MWETEQFWGTIDLHGIFSPTIEINGLFAKTDNSIFFKNHAFLLCYVFTAFYCVS